MSGHTTLPLVVGWGFLFIAAALAPAFSPRCPYKTTLLKFAMKAIWRQHLSLVWWLRTACNFLNPEMQVRNSSMGARRSPDSQTQLLLPGNWSYEDLAYDEEAAAKTDAHDLDILITVDSIQSDDDLLLPMMDTLRQPQIVRTECVKFALAIISHRLQDDITIPSSGFLDLMRLPKQTTSIIMRSIVEILRHEIKTQLLAGDLRQVEWHDWMQDCLSLLFAKTNTPIPAQANLLFSSLLTDQSRRTDFFNVIKTRASDVTAVFHIHQKLQETLVLMNGEDVLLVLYHLVQQYFSPESAITYEAVLDTLKNPAKVPPDYVQLLVDTLVSFVRRELLEPEYSSYTKEKLTLIIELWPKTSLRDGVLNLFHGMLINNSLFPGLGRYAMGLNRGAYSSGVEEEAQKIFIDAILAASRSSGELYGDARISGIETFDT
ncbi:hypothetical protein BC835DRAFT_987271 [Cytidiella melzeri]|nr:hypothetical protein BC835DRAFT_987271 [Cytidiella melzeri]